MSLKKIYTSNKYYSQTYYPISSEESTKWTANHFFVIKSIFPQIYSFRNKKVLEVGSSYGGFINNLNKEGFIDVTASDMNKALLYKEIKNKYIHMDITKTNKHKERYDVIFAFDVLEHILESEKVAENIFSLLSKDGLFIFSVPYPRKLNLYDPYHISMHYPNYWTNIFKRDGFTLLKLEEITFLPYIWRYVKPFFFFKRPMQHRVFTSEIFFIFKKTSIPPISKLSKHR